MPSINPQMNPLVRDTGSPPIPEAQGWTRSYNGALGPLIDLSQAVPGYPPHPDMLRHLSEAAGTVAAARYGDILGDQPLRDAYSAEIVRRYGGDVSSNDVAITAGCNQAFVVTMMTIARQGDSVIVPSPWYFNHDMTLGMLGIKAEPLPCQAANGFVPSCADAEKLITPSTRAIVLVTPNNPTGAIYPAETVAEFAALCRKRGLWLVVDETYRDFLAPDHGAPHRLFSAPDWRDNILQLYSFSKSYCIPGHRTGAITGGPTILDEIAKVLDCVQICAPRAAQKALTWAIPSLDDWRAANTAEILRRVTAFKNAFALLPEWRIDSIGAYFAYVAHPFTGIPVQRVAERLASERGVLGLPGPYFGAGQEQHMRLAFANVTVESLGKLPERLKKFKP